MLTLQEIRLWAISERSQGRKIVATNGCFDIYHAGHAEFLRAAWLQGDVLVVGLNDDKSISTAKGLGRPINKLEDRATVLESVRWVSHVVPFSGKTAKRFLAAVRPDVWVKGGGWTLDTLDEGEREIVEKGGGTVKVVHIRTDISTSTIVDKIRC